MRGADDDRVSGDDRRGVQTDLAGDEVHRLIVVLLQIDDAVFAEARDRSAGFRVERDEAIARRDVEDPFFAAVGPVRQAAARELARRGFAALAFVLAVHPQQLAGCRVERDDGPPRAGGRVDDAVDHQRRRFELVLGPRTEAVGLEPPRDLELAEVVGVDLIERRIPRVAEVGAVGRPLAVFRARLAGNGERHPDQQSD